MLQTKLNDGLSRYQIGEKLRTLRLRKKMGLVELGKATGLSSAMLSKIERGRLFPTLKTLMRIAMAFGVGLEHFFTNADARARVSIVRKRDRVRVPCPNDGRPAAYHFEPIDFLSSDHGLNAYYAEFADRAHQHAHPGAELLFLLTGKLLVAVDDEEHLLEPGDAMCFDASRTHRYARAGLEPCAAIVVLTA